LEPTDRKGGLFSEEYDPEDEQLQLLHQMGWTYRARRGQFHIYSSDDPGAPELNTDPQVQAVTMSALTQFLRKKVTNALFTTLLYLILYFGDILISSTLLLGTPLVLLFAGLMLWDLGCSLKALMVLVRWRNQLRRGQPLPHRSDYRRSGWRYLTTEFLRKTLWIVFFLCAAWRVLYIEVDEPYEKIADQHFPFYTVADYYPGAEIKRTESISEFYTWEDLLSPENYDFREYTEVKLNGETFDCWLSVNYHRTRWEWTARRLAREFVSQAGANRLEQTAAKIFGDEPVIATEIALPDADYCAWFYKHRNDPYMVIQKNNVVIQVNLEVPGSAAEPTPEELARLILLQIQ
ncbi:MAG: DUF2812 domain-containing protein, partial [Oscillospiraceae bacterium]|nr:DUF2812 domain-containing protein [Oscillospiraceae bacterium]